MNDPRGRHRWGAPVAGVGQWTLALALAALLHLLLAWLLVPEPRTGDAAEAQRGGPRVQAMAAGTHRLPLLGDAGASPSVLADASPTDGPALLRAVVPPEPRPMTAPVAKAEPRAVVPKVRSRAARADAEPAGRSSSSRSSRPPAKPQRSARGGDGDARQGRGGSAGAKSPAAGGRGADRSAAPVSGNPKPGYPRLARSRGHEGRVLIQVSVLGNGRVGSARVAGSSGHASLDRAALRAVKRWRFRPALRNGKPVTATIRVPVVFRLEG